jgi:hypothetical protein
MGAGGRELDVRRQRTDDAVPGLARGEGVAEPARQERDEAGVDDG